MALKGICDSVDNVHPVSANTKDDGDHFYTKRTYTDPRVKLHDWELQRESYPKDNDPYVPPCGDYFMATYNRWGVSQEPTGTSETHDMLGQIEMRSKLEYLEVIKPRPMVNFLSYDPTNSETRRLDLEVEGLTQYPPDYGTMDYTSTMLRDYKPPHPELESKPLSIPSQHPLMNRMSISELSGGQSVRRKGTNTFMDDNVEEYHRFTPLRGTRGHVTFDPARVAFTFANHEVSPTACDGKYDIKE